MNEVLISAPLVMAIKKIRNVAIVAHVDHGKTTLVDKLLQQSGTFDKRDIVTERVMDNNDLEKERGITILSKNTAIRWKSPKGEEYRINIVDTPGHADFGGEVERVLSMVDSVLILVDAIDGPMPQTRFVTQKAFAMGFKPIVVINKIDRPSARPNWVLDQTFDLFDRLGASNDQLDFHTVYASALHGYATLSPDVRTGNMTPLFQAIIDHVSPPHVKLEDPFQMRITSLSYNNYVGVIGTGRVQRGKVHTNMPVSIINREGKVRAGKVLQVMSFMGLERIDVPEATAGDIIAISGIENLNISETVCAIDEPEQLPVLTVDEPTISMTFQTNDSPFAGNKDRSGGKFLTSRQLRSRLMREALHNVALKVEETEDSDKFKVSGRGELHLSILIETMRREGYELAVSRPEVIIKIVDGKKMEPFENLVIDLEEQYQGVVMQRLGERRGQLTNLEPDGKGRVRIDFMIPARSLIGFQTEFRTITAGTGLLFHVFDHFGPHTDATSIERQNGVLISNGTGPSPPYAQISMQERGRLMIEPSEEVYEGQVVGINSKDNDLTVNALRAKQLSNFRASGKDDDEGLIPPLKLSLEETLEFIANDELVEVTPIAIRIRKKQRTENDRKRASRG